MSADLNSNSLIVSASPQYFDQVVQVVEALDAQPPEVVIQALLVEVTLDSTDEFGIELGLQDPLLLARSLVTTTTGATTSVHDARVELQHTPVLWETTAERERFQALLRLRG